MGKTFKRIMLTAGGMTIAWAALIKPRTKNTPDMAAFYDYDYADGGVHDFFDNRPENSMAAYRLAISRGYALAIDVRITKDGVPVVFRDHDLWRLCGVDGSVENTEFPELCTYYLI